MNTNFDENNENSVNKAEEMNKALFAKEEKKECANIEQNKKENVFSYGIEESPESKKVYKKYVICILAFVLVLITAFTGAFYGMISVCSTAILGDSDFFSALIAQNSGIKINSIIVDKVQGEYIDDDIEIANKVLKTTVEINVLTYNEITDKYVVVSNGSGVIVSEDGIVVSNYHVVSSSNTYKIITEEGVTYNAECLYVDEKTDLSILKIITTTNIKFTPVTFADSDDVKAGLNVVACGNPLGLGLSVSYGHVSHASRDIGDGSGNFIQVDASVNPGNSGGGLYDRQGNLLGIVTAKAKGDNVDGIGYVIPANRVLSVMNDLLKFGYVKGRPALGITIVNVDVSTWSYFNSGELEGLLADMNYGVYVISSKYYTDLQKGDKIAKFDGTAISTKEELTSVLAKYKPGDEVILTIQTPTKGTDGIVTVTEHDIKIVLKERDWADELPRIIIENNIKI